MNDPTNRFWTLANIVTFGRLVLLIPLFMGLRAGEAGNRWAIVVMVAALLTDMLDGLIARHYNQVSEWGKVLDPVADKLWLGCLAVFLALPTRQPPLPWQFLAILFGRYLLVLAGGWYAYRRTGVIMMSNWFGKVTMVGEALTMVSYTIYWTDGMLGLRPEWFLYFTVVMIVVSTGVYAWRFFRIISN